MDLQGAELLALQGMGDLLNGVRYVHTELSFRAMYTGQALFADVHSYLHTRGFGLTTGVSGCSRQMEFIGTRGFEANVFFWSFQLDRKPCHDKHVRSFRHCRPRGPQ